MESNKQQTPITPESLEGIGFENNLSKELWLQITRKIQLSYFIKSGKFEISFEDFDDVIVEYIYFTSIEQLTEWLKPFTKGENNE